MQTIPWKKITFPALCTLLATLAGLAATAQIWLYGLQNPDSRWVGAYYIADEWDYLPYWETSQGRWALRLVDLLLGGVHQAPFVQMAALLLFAAGAVLAVRLLAPQSRWLCLAAPLLVVCSPCVAEILTYRYCCASYGLAFLLAVLAVYAAQRLPGWPGLALGMVCLAACLGLYQAYLSVAAVLCLGLLLRQLLLPGPTPRAVGCSLGRYLLLALGGCVGYYLVLQLFLHGYGVEMTSFNGASEFGLLHLLASLPQSVPTAYGDFFAFLFRRSVVVNSFTVRPVYAALLALAALGLAVRLHRRPLWVVGSAAAVVVLLPLAANAMDLIIPESTLMPRSALGLVACLLVLAALAAATPPLLVRCPWPTALCALVVAGLLRGYVLQNNTDSAALLQTQRMCTTLAAQVHTSLQATAGYTPQATVAVVGYLPGGNYTWQPPAADKVNTTFLTGLTWKDNAHCTLNCWRNFYAEELGLQLNWCDVETYAELCGSEAFWAMPCYPEAGSIQQLDGVWVVKISDV